MSNEELFKQALVEGVNRHIDKTIEEEKQIEKMAKIIYDNRPIPEIWQEEAEEIAHILYNAGYRKQSEGEWETIPDYSRSLITYRHICSVCKTFYKDIRSRGHTYCHECGSKMKGGEE